MGHQQFLVSYLISTYDSAFPLLDSTPPNKIMCPPKMFVASFFIITKSWEQPKCFSEDQINWSEILVFNTKKKQTTDLFNNMNLKKILLRKRSQMQKITHCATRGVQEQRKTTYGN